MSLNPEERRAVITLEYEKALKTYSYIPTLVSNQMWDLVANRLYYSAFHAALALLINDGHKTSTHRGIVALLGMHYIKTGILSIEEGKMYSRLQSMRDESDYNCAFTASQEDIEPYVAQVGEFLTKIRHFLTCLDGDVCNNII